MTAKAEYATRAMVALAAADGDRLVKADALAAAQSIPPQFLSDILADLRAAGLVRSQRGADGGYALTRAPDAISIADVLRCIEGSLASVHDTPLSDLDYAAPVTALTDVWRALRASMREVLESTTLADVVAGRLPERVADLADLYRRQEAQRGRR
jgi:Rrf2 family protein